MGAWKRRGYRSLEMGLPFLRMIAALSILVLYVQLSTMSNALVPPADHNVVLFDAVCPKLFKSFPPNLKWIEVRAQHEDEEKPYFKMETTKSEVLQVPEKDEFNVGDRGMVYLKFICSCGACDHGTVTVEILAGTDRREFTQKIQPYKNYTFEVKLPFIGVKVGTVKFSIIIKMRSYTEPEEDSRTLVPGGSAEVRWRANLVVKEPYYVWIDGPNPQKVLHCQATTAKLMVKVHTQSKGTVVNATLDGVKTEVAELEGAKDAEATYTRELVKVEKKHEGCLHPAKIVFQNNRYKIRVWLEGYAADGAIWHIPYTQEDEIANVEATCEKTFQCPCLQGLRGTIKEGEHVVVPLGLSVLLELYGKVDLKMYPEYSKYAQELAKVLEKYPEYKEYVRRILKGEVIKLKISYPPELMEVLWKMTGSIFYEVIPESPKALDCPNIGLPPGLQFDNELGAVYGEPDRPGRWCFAVNIRDRETGDIVATLLLDLTVEPPKEPPQFYATATVQASQSATLRPDQLSPEFWAYLAQGREVTPITTFTICLPFLGCSMQVSGGIEGVTFQPVPPGTELPDWTPTELPPGLQLNPQVGALFGVPLLPGTWYPAIQAIDQESSQTLAILKLELAVEPPEIPPEEEVPPEEEENLPPHAEFTCSAEWDPELGAYIAFTGETIFFDAEGAYDTDGTIVSYRWDFGDGTSATGVTAQKQYWTPGVYQVCLRVLDNRGAADTVCATIHVLQLG